MKFEIDSKLDKEESIRRIRVLLTKRSVKFRSTDESIESTSTPLCILNGDRRALSQNNWIGINPFQFVSNVSIHITEESIVEIETKDGKALSWILFWWILGIPLSLVEFPFTLFVLFVPTIATLTIWYIFLKHLIPLEIENSLREK